MDGDASDCLKKQQRCRENDFRHRCCFAARIFRVCIFGRYGNKEKGRDKKWQKSMAKKEIWEMAI